MIEKPTRTMTQPFSLYFRQVEMLDRLEAKLGKKRSAIVRDAIEAYYMTITAQHAPETTHDPAA